MNRLLFFFIYVLFLFSCKSGEKETRTQVQEMVEVKSKLENLLRLSPDTVLVSYDLSNDFLMDFPDLSAYTIRSLDLSHNYLDTIIPSFLPKGIEVLDLSHNYLRRFPRKRNFFETLKELNMSYNYIEVFSPYFFINKLDISHNNLNKIVFNWCYMYYYGYWRNRKQINMNYLNISDNPNLDNKVLFIPSMIDTIIYNNIANDKKLEMIDWELKSIE